MQQENYRTRNLSLAEELLELRLRTIPFVIWLIGTSKDQYGRVTTRKFASKLMALAKTMGLGLSFEFSLKAAFGNEILDAWRQTEPPGRFLIVAKQEELKSIAEKIREAGNSRDKSRMYESEIILLLSEK